MQASCFFEGLWQNRWPMKYTSKKPDQNGFVDYTSEENETWHILYDRQIQVVQERGCPEYLAGLKQLNFPTDRVPQCAEVTKALKAATGWAVQPVAAMIPLKEFFALLANRHFPAATFIRTRADLDYLQEPDIFHEYFGHCPMLAHQAYADFVQWYGESALKMNKQVQSILGRLFWFTVEFGLIQTAKGLRIYGGGILSSFEETVYALESDIPLRKKLNVVEVLNQTYRYDVMQDRYFYIENLTELFALKSDKIVKLAESIARGDTDYEDFLIC